MICVPTTLAIGIRQGSNNPVAEAQTHDALTQVLIADDGELLARLRLSAAEAARVCNVTPRQLIYWTKKGLVKPSSNGDHDYDVFAMEKVIRIRQALEKGHSLEKAAQLVQREMGTLQAEAKRLDEMLPDALEDELRARLERLESRIKELRRAPPASLTIARPRKAGAGLGPPDAPGGPHGTPTNRGPAKAPAPPPR